MTATPARPEPGETLRAALTAHHWSATDDETCSCGWVAPNWAAACTGNDDEAGHAASLAAHAAFVEHQAVAVLAHLATHPEDVPAEARDHWKAQGAAVERLLDAVMTDVPPPRWDEDPVVLANGWNTPDRCGRCGEPRAAGVADTGEATP